jgi:hypothetical protein
MAVRTGNFSLHSSFSSYQMLLPNSIALLRWDSEVIWCPKRIVASPATTKAAQCRPSFHPEHQNYTNLGKFA